MTAQMATSAAIPSAALPKSSAVVMPASGFATDHDATRATTRPTNPLTARTMLCMDAPCFDGRARATAGGGHRVERVHHRLPNTIEGSGAAMNSSITGASTAIVGTSMAARRLVAV